MAAITASAPPPPTTTTAAATDIEKELTTVNQEKIDDINKGDNFDLLYCMI